MSYKMQCKVLTYAEVILLLMTLYFLGLSDMHIDIMSKVWKMCLFGFIIVSVVRFIIIPSHRKFQYGCGIILLMLSSLLAPITHKWSCVLVLPALYLFYFSHVIDKKRERIVDFKTLTK